MPDSVDEKTRLSGARGDFVASLGRRLQTLRAALRSLEEQPASRERRNALLRRAHALGASARVLGFASVAEALAEAERAIARSKLGPRPTDLAEVSRVLDVVPSLVGGAAPSLRPPPPEGLGPEHLTGRQWPLSLLLFGGTELEHQLTEAVEQSSVEFERSDDVEAAAQIARVLGPDLVLIDADAPRAHEFFSGLGEDELTEPVNSILIGDFIDPNQPRELTVLGATRVLKKPVSNDTLRRTIEELTESPSETAGVHKPLGDLTVRGLAARLAEELEKGLTQATLPGTQATHVPFGEGTDVLAAIWGTVTRVRELVTLRSHGTVRFEPTGPEGGIPLAPWIDRDRRAGERGAKRGRDEVGVSLAGRTVLVADDDPAVTWFLSGLLKTVGAEVVEAYDGVSALEMAHQRWPDLVISDIVMPKLDGFALCREIKRDVAVRDTPVILLSWKEDLLQRMRELGADADGYLKKEAEASTVVQRIREVMRPRARVEARVRQGGEVRGRLDGLTPRLILELCCGSRENLRIEFRDAFFVYTMHVRYGRLVSALRRAASGAELTGYPVVRSVLGVNAGRFLVVPDTAPVPTQFEGSLREVLAPAIDHARQCLSALSHQRLASIERLDLVHDELEFYLGATPEPAQTMLRLIADGARPGELLLGGAVPPELVSQALADLARRGVVERLVQAGRGSEPPPEPSLSSPGTLGGTASRQGEVVVAEAPKAPSAPVPALQPASSLGAGAPAQSPRPSAAAEAPPFAGAPADKSPVEESTMNSAKTSLRAQPSEPAAFTFQLSPEPPVATAGGQPSELSTEEAMDAAWFAAPGAAVEAEAHDALAEALSNAATQTPPPARALPLPARAAPRPDSASSAELPPAQKSAPTLPRPITIDDPLTEPPVLVTPTSGHQISQLLTAPSEEPAQVVSASEPTRTPDPFPKTKPLTFPAEGKPSVAGVPHATTGKALEAQTAPTAPTNEPTAAPPEPAPIPEQTTSASSVEAPREPNPTVKDTSTFKVIGYALVAMAFSYIGMSALVAWLSDSNADQVGTAPVETTAQAALTDDGASAVAAAEAPSAAVAQPAAKPPAKSEPATQEVAIEDLPVPAGLALGADKGVLKLVTPDAHSLYVDGEFAGRGPVRIVPVPPGKHTIKTRFDGEERSYEANVHAGRMTRLTISSAK